MTNDLYQIEQEKNAEFAENFYENSEIEYKVIVTINDVEVGYKIRRLGGLDDGYELIGEDWHKLQPEIEKEFNNQLEDAVLEAYSEYI